MSVFLVLFYIVYVPWCFEVASARHLPGTFFLKQAPTCEEQRTIVDVLTTLLHITDPELTSRVEALFTPLASAYRHQRQQLGERGDRGTTAQVAPLSETTVIPRRRLAEETVVNRRDEAMAALEFLYRVSETVTATHHGRHQEQKTSVQSNPALFLSAAPLRQLENDNDTTPRLNVTYLPILQIDIVRHDATSVFELAKLLPCLLYPPDRDQEAVPAMVPNDDFVTATDAYVGQWHLGGPEEARPEFRSIVGVNLLKAWDRYRGESDGMIVGLIDTGCTMHPDLEMNLCPNRHNDTAGLPADHDNNAFDEPVVNVHGTQTAGLIAGVTNNHAYLAGACWGCKIMCLKVASTPSGIVTVAAMLKAYEFAANRSVRLILVALTHYENSDAEYDALTVLGALGAIIVAPSGNDGCNYDAPVVSDERCSDYEYERPVHVYPGMYEGLRNFLVVTSVDRFGELSYFGNYGSRVKFAAPGDSIWTIYNTMVIDKVVVARGTSFAAAIATGVIALAWSSRPFLTSHEIVALLEHYGGRPLNSLKGITQWAFTIDAALLLEAVNGTRDPPIPVAYPRPTHDRTPEFYEQIFNDGSRCSPSLVSFGRIILVLFLVFSD